MMRLPDGWGYGRGDGSGWGYGRGDGSGWGQGWGYGRGDGSGFYPTAAIVRETARAC